jgi:hypothetical protein
MFIADKVAARLAVKGPAKIRSVNRLLSVRAQGPIGEARVDQAKGPEMPPAMECHSPAQIDLGGGDNYGRCVRRQSVSAWPGLVFSSLWARPRIGAGLWSHNQSDFAAHQRAQ